MIMSRHVEFLRYLTLSIHGTRVMSQVSNRVGTKLLFENDRVRVWDLALEPGESTGLHRHESDFLYVVIGDGELQTRFADGSVDPPRQMNDGDVRFRFGDETRDHEAINTGSSPWRNIVVEFKDESPESAE